MKISSLRRAVKDAREITRRVVKVLEKLEDIIAYAEAELKDLEEEFKSET